MSAIPIAWQVLLQDAFRRCAEAGFGRVEQVDGVFLFEAFPGLEDAAADFVERQVLGSDAAS